MAIQACPRCGCRSLHMPGLEDGVVPETDNLNQYVCDECGLKANPIEFTREADYEAFRKALE